MSHAKQQEREGQDLAADLADRAVLPSEVGPITFPITRVLHTSEVIPSFCRVQ